MNRRHARSIREGVIIARKDYLFLALFIPAKLRDRTLASLLRTGGPSSAVGGCAYAVTLTRLTRKATS